MGLLSKLRYAYHLVRNTVLLRDLRYARAITPFGISPVGLSVNPRGLHFAELNITVPLDSDTLLRHIKDATALKHQAGVNFHDSEEGIVADLQGFKAHVSSGEELFILREILCDGVYNFGTAANNVVVWDIGMNAGLASLYFAARPYVRAVVAFEPFRPTFDAAGRNFELNPELQSKIKPHNVGVAARSYTTEAEYSSTWKGNVSVRGFSPNRKELLRIPDGTLTTERIELLSADEVLKSILADYPEHAVVAKIDCEGSEYEILHCLREKHLLQKISIIMLEWHQRGPGELQAMLHDSGFSTYSPCLLDSAAGMLYAIKQGPAERSGPMETSLSTSDKSEPGPQIR